MKKHIFLSVLLSAIIILGGGLIISGLKTAEKTAYVAQNASKQTSIPLNADTIFDLVNQERVKAGVKPLVRDDRLNATAQARADDMVARNYFSHFDPVTGEKMIDKQDAGCHFSENLSVMYDPIGDNNQDTISGWLNSQAHKDAMLRADYTNTGVAVNGTKVAQHFCTR